ncbi:pyrroloquinoline quinone precursor peptide PqqA [Saccharopolyspora erythraea]|uniref:pyrroloquinoline quinone precursor peptide PqqA n=1 Tax=Saccharopolyspora erythraea TaxID=1836 RepID=UPI0032C245FB
MEVSRATEGVAGIRREEVQPMESDATRSVLTWEPPEFEEAEWEAPEFEELMCASEVTMYIARMEA